MKSYCQYCRSVIKENIVDSNNEPIQEPDLEIVCYPCAKQKQEEKAKANQPVKVIKKTI